MNIIIHCSDAPNGRNDRAKDVHRWHRGKGWDGIGYHFFICVDGAIENGRPLYWEGAHCRGHNEKIGICLAGKDKFTSAQAESLEHLIFDLCQGDIDNLNLYGHYQLDSRKTCPNFDVRAWFNGEIDWPILE